MSERTIYKISDIWVSDKTEGEKIRIKDVGVEKGHFRIFSLWFKKAWNEDELCERDEFFRHSKKELR